MRSALVLGASGQIGRFLIPKLLARGYRVVALSRAPRTSSTKNLHWIQGDLFSAMEDPGPVDAIFSLGPLNGFARWIEHADLHGHPRLVALGSMSVVSKRHSTDAAERQLAATLHQAEIRLRDAASQKQLDWTLLRPTMIYGAGLDRSLSPLARIGMRWRVFPRIDSATGLRQPVHAEDLADACLSAVQTPRACQQVLDLGGGERLSFSEMLERVRASLPRRSLGIALTPGVLRAMLGILRIHPRWRGMKPQVLERLGTDLVADDQRARELLDWSPRGFGPVASTWVETRAF